MVSTTNPYIPPRPEDLHVKRLTRARKRREMSENDQVFSKSY